MVNGFTDHPQVFTTCPTGEDVSVDESMVEILQAFWAHGVATYWSCQGTPRRRRRRSLRGFNYVTDLTYVAGLGNDAAEAALARLCANPDLSAHLYEHGTYEGGWAPFVPLPRPASLIIERDWGFENSGPRFCVRFSPAHRDLVLDLLTH